MDEPRTEEVIVAGVEEAHVEKRAVLKGRVRVETSVEVVEERVSAMLKGEVIDVVRVPVGTTVTAVPEIRTEGDLTIVPVVEEVLVVEKRLVLREELHIRRTATTEEVDQTVALRRQSVSVTRLDPEPRTTTPGDDHDL